MARKRAAFHTLGCKTNHYETDGIRQQFARAGFELVPFSDEADVYLVNTCTVTGEADRKSRQMLRRARQINPRALVVALGCQVVLGDAAQWADIVIGNEGKTRAVGAVLEKLAERSGSAIHNPAAPPVPDAPVCGAGVAPGDPAGEQAAVPVVFEEFGPVDQQSETRAYVKIEDGCNHFCSYCAIPLARGRVRSRAGGRVLQEVAALAAAGYREIVLTGIHVCSYGSDRGQPSHAVMELAAEIAAVPGIDRIRLGSLEPLSVTPAFIELASRNPKLCPHFHLSLQSGSDDVLRRMNRQYRTIDYRAVVENLRRSFADPGLTTDVIVGFPGETAAEFSESLSFCTEMAFSRMHVFRFSARQGTRAAAMAGQVNPEVVNSRSRQMLDLAGKMAGQYNGRQIGRLHQVLLERLRLDGFYESYTPEYVPALVASSPELASGQIISVRGDRCDADFLICCQP